MSNFEGMESKDLLELTREKILRCKVICLSNMNLDPITTNPKYMRPSQKNELIKNIEEKMKLSDDEIHQQFNAVVLDKILAPGVNPSNYPTYVDKRFKIQDVILEESVKDPSEQFMKWRENIDHNGNEIIHPLIKEAMEKKAKEEAENLSNKEEETEKIYPVNMVYETDSE